MDRGAWQATVYSVTKSQAQLSDWACTHLLWGFPGGSDGQESACQCRRPGFEPWIRKIPWRRKWQSTLVFLPGEFHGQSLVGYSPRGHRIEHNWMTDTFNQEIIFPHLIIQHPPWNLSLWWKIAFAHLPVKMQSYRRLRSSGASLSFLKSFIWKQTICDKTK